MHLILRREHWLFIIAAFLSIFLSTWINYRETVINPDAICYLMSAETYTQSGFHAAMNLCGQARWPFYSVFIAIVSQFTHFPYVLTAYALNGLFSLISVCLFLLLIKELGGNSRVLIIGACIILLSHEFNSVRQYIIRDHGFWAFYLISVFALLRFVKMPQWRYAVMFSGSLLAATLFRIEGLIFLGVLPFVLLFCQGFSWQQRIQHCLRLHLPNIGIFIAMCGWLILHPQHSVDNLSRVGEVVDQLQHGMTLMITQFQNIKTALIQHVLTTDAMRDAGIVTLLVMIVWYVLYVIGNLSWIYSALVIYAWQRKAAQFSFNALMVLSSYIIVNLGVTASFFAQHLFLSKRYLIALSLIFMLWVPFALAKLKNKIILAISILVISISSLGGIFDFGYSKIYIHDAGDWLAAHVPPNASLYVNDYQLMYYSQHFKTNLFQYLQTYTNDQYLAQNKWQQYDFLALRLDDKAAINTIVKTIPLKPLKIFSNKRGDKIVIYQTKENTT